MKFFKSKVVYLILGFCLSSCDCLFEEDDPRYYPYDNIHIYHYFENVDVTPIHFNGSGSYSIINDANFAPNTIEIADFGLLVDIDIHSWVPVHEGGYYYVENEYFQDNILRIELNVQNVQTQTSVNINDNFRYMIDDNRLYEIDQMFEQNIVDQTNLEPLTFKLISDEDIPDSSIFTIDVFLESNEILYSKTDTIFFSNN